jgi:hypothetical protein
VPRARSRGGGRRIGRRHRIACHSVHVRELCEAPSRQRPHHARSDSMSASTLAISARSSGSAVSASDWALTTRRWRATAASTSAERIASETGVPSAVRAFSARSVSLSGRKVMTRAMPVSYLPCVTQRNTTSPAAQGCHKRGRDGLGVRRGQVRGLPVSFIRAGNPLRLDQPTTVDERSGLRCAPQTQSYWS